MAKWKNSVDISYVTVLTLASTNNLFLLTLAIASLGLPLIIKRPKINYKSFLLYLLIGILFIISPVLDAMFFKIGSVYLIENSSYGSAIIAVGLILSIKEV